VPNNSQSYLLSEFENWLSHDGTQESSALAHTRVHNDTQTHTLLRIPTSKCNVTHHPLILHLHLESVAIAEQHKH
jgi:hypothetical protein